jgi:hypothetical protein
MDPTPGSTFSRRIDIEIDIAAEELKAREQAEETERTWQQKGCAR